MDLIAKTHIKNECLIQYNQIFRDEKNQSTVENEQR